LLAQSGWLPAIMSGVAPAEAHCAPLDFKLALSPNGGAAKRLCRQIVRVPIPGCANDRAEVMLGRPADDLFRQTVVRDQHR
jgi:hypothetical protein